MTKLYLTAPLFTFLVVVGCDDPPPSHQRAWEELKITDYTIKQRRICFCAYVDQAMIVTVENGDVKTVVNEHSFEQLGHEPASWFKSVGDLFDWIESLEKRKVDALTVEYDETYSYPSLVSVDPLEDAMDDEMAYYTSELIPSDRR